MTYPIPDEAFDDRIAITGTSGAGKTYLTLGAISRLIKSGSRVIAIDPLGVMYGLRLMPDGVTPSSLKPVIFGGPHGDLPLSVGAATLIGETAATMAESCILDLSELGTKAAERRFMLGFLTALYRKANKDPVHLVIDEADMFAPQKLDDKEGEAAKLMGMMETIVRRGRVKGFIPWLITQRPAVLNKNVLSQADGVIAMKLTSSQDRDAIGGWIEGQADRAKGKEILGLLPTMDRGAGVVWIPGRSILKTAQFPENRTFDSSRTPQRGEARQAVDLKPLDLGKLKDRLAAVEQEAKANDPAVLKARIAQLEADARKRQPVIVQDDASKLLKADAAAMAAARLEGAEMVRGELPRTLDAQHAASFAGGIKAGLEYLIDKARNIAADPAVLVPVPDRKPLPRALMPLGNFLPKVPAKPAAAAKPVAMDAPHGRQPIAVALLDSLPPPKRDILAAMGFWKSVGTDQPTRAQVALVAKKSPSSGGFGQLIGALVQAQFITIPKPGLVELNPDSPYESMTAAEARAKIMDFLDPPVRQLVEIMIPLAPGAAITRAELAGQAGKSPTSGGFGQLVGQLVTLTIFEIPSPGSVKMSDWARGVLA